MHFLFACFLFLIRVIPSTSQSLSSNSSVLSNIANPNSISSNSTSLISSSFSFLIPYNQTQTCDIYGPLCQTGSITVPVSRGAGTTTTALPCSSYLTAQSSYLSGFQDPDEPGAIFARWPVDWQNGFGRSPECKSYAQAYRNRGQYTLSGCPADDAPIPAREAGFLPSQLPAAIFRQRIDQIYECCGDCSLLVQQVRLYYFPEKNASYCSSLNATLANSNTTTAALDNVPSIAITNGHTFTSPSLYLEVVGTAAVSDQCGGVGGTLTNPFITIPPGGLTTMSLPSYLYSVGGEYEDPSRNLGVNLGIFKALNVADLECPTFGLGLATGADGTVRTTVGPPYLPIIIPPPQALTLDPDWQKQCTGYQSALEGSPGFSFAIFDPPRALTAGAALIPSDPGGGSSPPNVPAEPTKSTPAAADPTLQPQQTPTPDGPKPTSAGDPGSGDASSGGQNKPPSDPQTPSDPSNQGGKTGGGSKNGNQGGNTPNQGNQGGGGSSQGDQGGGGSSQGNQNGDPSQQSGQGNQGGDKANPGNAAPNKPSTPSDVPAPNQQNPQPGNGLGGLIIGGLNGGPPQPGNPSDPTAADPATLTVGGQVITANPSNVLVSGSTLTPGGNGITVSGTSLSLGNDGNLVVNGDSIPIPYAPLRTSPPVLTVGGQSFTALPNGFAVAGSSVVPGGPPVVVSGTPIVLGYSGVLTVGSSSTILPNAPTVPTAKIFTVGGQTFTASPTGFAVGGTTLVPGGSAATISGTAVSLGPSGALFVGSSSTNLLPTSAPAEGTVFTLGGLTFTESSSNVLVDGTALTPGGPAATVAGARLSLASDGKLAVGSLTTNLPLSMNSGAVFTAGGLVFTEGSSDLVVDGKTVSPGGSPITIAGTPISLASNGKLIVGSSTTTLPTNINNNNNGPIFTAGGLIFTEQSSDLVVDGTTLFPGGSPITIAGTPISLAPNGKLIVGSSTTTLPTGPVFTAGGLVFTEESSDLVVDGTTLFPGGSPVTIAGTSISLAPDGHLVVGTSTTTVPTASSMFQSFKGGAGGRNEDRARRVGVVVGLVCGVVFLVGGVGW